MEGLENFNFSVAKLLVEDINIAQDLMLTHHLLFCCNLLIYVKINLSD
jgi:hypothetical protein